MNERTLTSNLAITQPKLTAAQRSSKSQFPLNKVGAVEPAESLELCRKVETENPWKCPKFRPSGNTAASGRAKNNATGKGVLVFIGV
jgi:hypothetical protein